MPLSFFEFLGQLGRNPALLGTVLLTLAVLLVNGWTDAPNAIAGVVVTGALPFRPAVLLAAVCNLLGVLCVTSVNASVAETVYSIASFGGGPKAALTALCAAMTAIVLWAVVAWRFGIPTSESHALVAGISGAAAALEGSFSCIRWDCWAKVIAGLLLSAAAGFFAGQWVFRRLNTVKLSSHTVRIAQLSGAAAAAFLHGAQDGQKFIGVFLLGTALAQGRADEGNFLIPLWLMALCALFMALGTLIGGKKIIDTVGREMVSLRHLLPVGSYPAGPACFHHPHPDLCSAGGGIRGGSTPRLVCGRENHPGLAAHLPRLHGYRVLDGKMVPCRIA